DLVVCEHDLRTVCECVLHDNVDCGGLDLDEIRVCVHSRKLRLQTIAPREIAGDVDDVGIEMVGRRWPRCEHGDAALEWLGRAEAERKVLARCQHEVADECA